jgi:hypothetical protein
MPSNRLITGALSIVLLGTGCIALTDPIVIAGGTRIVGSGRVITVSRTVSDFTRVRVNGVAHMTIERTGVESLSITADDNIVPVLHSNVENGSLFIGPEDGTEIRTSTEIFYRLTVKDLQGIDINGVITVDAAGLDTDRLDVSINGVSTLNAEGRADRQFITLNGVSSYLAANVDSREATVEADGVLTVVVKVSERLDVFACGAGTVEYIGDPVVDVHDTCVAIGVRKR